jgi:hypothetical protein
MSLPQNGCMRNQRLVATLSGMQHCLPDGCELVAFQPTSWYHSSRISAVSGFCLLFDHYVLHSARVANVMYVFWRCAPTSFRRLSHSHNIKAHLHTSSPCQSSICRPLCRKQSDVMSSCIIFLHLQEPVRLRGDHSHFWAMSTERAAVFAQHCICTLNFLIALNACFPDAAATQRFAFCLSRYTLNV